MNPFEKMLFLKSMPLFKFVKDEILLSLSPLLEEEVVPKGKLIIQQGDLDATMYLIVTGKVKVHEGDVILKELGDREIFGELAALSPEIRIASVSTLEETLLLKITHNVLDDFMEMEPGLSKGLIQVLCQKIRTLAKDFNQLLASQ